MPKDELEMVEVAAVVIVRDRKILAVYNDKWGSFTLPMTKRRMWKEMGVRMENEEWDHAATRAAAEWLAKTFLGAPAFCIDAPEWEQGDRDGRVKRYSFKVYELILDEDQELIHGAHAEWLTPKEFFQKDRQPVSPTAKTLLKELMAQSELQGNQFP